MKATLGESRLEALLESAQLLHATLELNDLLRHLLRTVMGRLLVAKGMIAVSEEGIMRLALRRGLRGSKTGEEFREEDVRRQGIEIILPIGDPRDPVGLLGIGRPPREMDAEETEFLKALLGIAANGIGNARSHAKAQELNLNLNQKLQDLRTLLELVQSLTAVLEPDAIAQLLSLTLAGRWGVSKYFVLAWKEGHPPVKRRRGMAIPDIDLMKAELQGVPEAIMVEQLPDGELRAALSEQKCAVLLLLRSGDAPSGAVALGARLGGLPYTPSHLEFGAGLVGQAVVAFENSWHFQETLEKKKIEQELHLAASIQQDLFPSEFPGISGFEVDAYSRAARAVGGDYYDALRLEGEGESDPILICVADVSGKGIPAALLMSSIQATLRALLSSNLSLVDLVSRTSELLYATTPANKYATAIFLLIDPKSGTGKFVNAGHNDGIRLRADGTVDNWKSTGPPLGLLPGLPFEEMSFELSAGDLVVLYSDGVVEAQNRAEEEFEEERFVDRLRESYGHPLNEIVTDVFAALDQFAGDAPQHDDITLLLLRRKAAVSEVTR